MLLKKISSWISSQLQADAITAANIQPAETFRQIVDRERKRVERFDGKFSLLVLNLACEEDLRVQVAGLAEILERRLRATDVAGFIDEVRIGIVLAGTPEKLAWQVADEIVPLCEGFMPPHCEVFVYPSNPMPPAGWGQDSSEETETGGSQRGIEALMFVRPMPRWKRAIDVLGAVTGLVVLSPIMLATMAAIKLTSRGPVFFAQRREGLGGRFFDVYKFRTMVVDAEEQKAALRAISEQDGPAFKLKNDPRVTSIGRYLRKTCIDELPQLLNVLKGDMSLVGPRPLPVDESQQCESWQRRRLEVTPGLTCIWQVDGKSRVPFVEWMRMDIRYMRGRNFFQDAKLVFRTAVNVLLHRASH